MDLRDYQKEIVENTIKSRGNVLLGLPTGGGKTVIASELIRIYNYNHYKVVFLVPRIDLLQQAIDTFTNQGLSVGTIWKSIDQHDEVNDVYVSVRQTMYRKGYFNNWIKDKILIVDEAHIGLEAQHDYYMGARKVIGLTATPEQMSGKSMLKSKEKLNITNPSEVRRYTSAVYDSYLYPYQIKDLQSKGYLAEYTIDSSTQIKLPEEMIRRWKRMGKLEGDFKETERILLDNEGAILKCLEKDVPTIVFTPTVEAATNILKRLDSNKWAVVTGDTKKEDREVLYSKVKEGQLTGLINCGVLTTGFDLPCIKRIILCRHILSKSLFIQIIGRALRPYNNQKAEIVDLLDSYSNFKNEVFLDGSIVWKPEGWNKNIGDPIEDSIPRERREEYARDPMGTLRLLYVESMRALEDMEDAMKAYESDIEIVPCTRVEKQVVYVSDSNNPKNTPASCYNYIKKGFYEDSKKLVPRILGSANYESTTATEEQRNKAAMSIWNNVMRVDIKDICSKPEWRSTIEAFLKSVKWWLDHFTCSYGKATA